VVSNISKLLDAVIDIKEGSANCAAPEVILTRFIAPSEEDAVGIWQEYNKVNQEVNENPVMEEFIPAIARYAEDFPYYDKCTYSCFSEPNVRAAADKAMVHGGDIVLTGVVSECCVLSTFFQGADLGYHFVYLKDACAGLNDETEKATLKILEGLAPLHVRIMTTEEYYNGTSGRAYI
jgi:nicotinamidase-related amidase